MEIERLVLAKQQRIIPRKHVLGTQVRSVNDSRQCKPNLRTQFDQDIPCKILQISGLVLFRQGFLLQLRGKSL